MEDLSTTGLKYAYLTFDDGPHAEFTPRILETLRRAKAKATFFVIGRRLLEPTLAEIVLSAVSDGHRFGNHTLTHPDLTKCSEQEIRRQLTVTADLLRQLGIETKLVRPPFGRTNATVAHVVQQLGFELLLWNNDPRDWAAAADDSQWTKDAIAAVEQNAATLIVCHDTHERTALHLGALVADLATRGYRFATLGAPQEDADSRLP
jgi:peptidoglycan/xylan/chitin deacetylase (PgdA/CDA1 family)